METQPDTPWCVLHDWLVENDGGQLSVTRRCRKQFKALADTFKDRPVVRDTVSVW